MSDAVTLARMARESLSQGLNALQGDPNVPRHLLDLAPPIARAMSSLHQIERSGGAEVGANAQAALGNLQNALAHLQSQPPEHPAVTVALEAVAGALASVHALVRAAAAPARTAPVTQQKPRPAGPPAPTPATEHRPAAAAQPQPSDARAAAPTPQVPAPQAQIPRAPVAPVPIAQPPIARAATPKMAIPPGARAPAGRAEVDPAPQAPQAAAHSPARAAVAEGAPVSAELGAHSASNFYKGLSGNDIIDHGGLFVSTYKLPKIGKPVRLKVSLPGGYEFEASAIVRWRREPSDAGNDAPPGFGAQFTEITPEARQLVYRYVRNREPLFHDDL